MVDRRFSPRFFVRARDADRAGAAGYEPREPASPLRTMDGEPVLELTGDPARLRQEGIRTYEADIAPIDAYLLAHDIAAGVRLLGDYTRGRQVDRLYLDPDIEAAEASVPLKILSFDIETSLSDGSVTTVSLVSTTLHPGERSLREEESLVLHVPQAPLASPSDAADIDIRSCESEAELLTLFREAISRMDPDILTGWNIVDFDLRVIFDRCRRHGIEPLFGRSSLRSVYLPKDASGAAGVVIHGRQAVDGIRLVRHGPTRFAGNSLDHVSREVLGEGKLVDEEDKLAELERLVREDPVQFCRYCLQDSRLVLRIFETTGLLALTLERARLVGVRLNLAWTSIQAFERLYISHLHRRGFVAPTLGVDLPPAGEAPGGSILTPNPGIHSDVDVFDFRSLYPSIIRTFNIDPLAHAAANRADEDVIIAPNGAAFSRSQAILPDMLAEFFEGRRQAKKRGDETASFVYKIVMNSFYGVLGAQGCRFAGVALAGAITGFGQMILKRTRDAMQGVGKEVLYGDTDSVFVRGPGPPGDELARTMSMELAQWVRSEYRVESFLQLEFEKRYRRLFLPMIRHVPAGGEARGRAKGYAGLRQDTGELEIKGMEAVRRDWTEFAKRTQRRLLRLLLEEESPSALAQCVRDAVEELRGGRRDDELVYEKGVRKRLEDYTAGEPAHIKAARMLPPGSRRGIIRYVMTVEGPQPASRRSADYDYEHYVEKQLRPVVETIAAARDPGLVGALGSGYQPDLFE